MGMLLAITLIQHLELGRHAAFLEQHRFLLVAVILSVCTALPFLVARLPHRRAEGRGKPFEARFWNRVAAFAPVTTAGLVAYQLAYVPGLAGLQLSLHGGGPEAAASGVSISLLAIVRLGVVLTGLLATVLILWRVNRRGLEQGAPPSKGIRRTSLGAAVGYGTLLLVLMLTR